MITRAAAWMRSLWWNLAHRNRVNDALDDELRAYVDLLAAENERAGMSPGTARRKALVDTGGVQQVKEATRGAWAGDTINTAVRELRYTLRSLRRSPVFLAVAVITLAIGIGGSTAVFTVIKGSLLRPLPGAAAPHRLVTIERVQSTGVDENFSYPDFRDLHEQSTALTGIAGFNGTSMVLGEPSASERAWVGFVTDNFFDVLGVLPASGRLFHASDASGGGGEAAQVAVLGYAMWQRRYAGADSAIGSTIELDARRFTIVGVSPPGFIGAMTPYPMDLWIPVMTGGVPAPAFHDIDFTSRREAWLRLVGRLAPEMSAADAQRDLAVVAARLAGEYPANEGRSVVVHAGAGMTAEERANVSRVPALLAVAVVVLLLIACGNVASLSLVRAAARSRELATRLALGASRAVLVRQVVLEGVVIGAAAGALGILLARLLVQSATLVRTVVPLDNPDLALDMRVLGVAIAASGLTAVLVSLLPVTQLFRVSPGSVLKNGSGGALRRRGGQRALVAAQVGASVVLLAAAVIVHGAFQRVLSAHDASAPRSLTDTSLDIRESMRDSTARIAFYRAVLERAAAEPGIAAAAVTSTVPPFQWSGRATVFRSGEEPLPGAPPAGDADAAVRVHPISISADFFHVMRIPVIRGRTFSASDDERSTRVAIIGRRLADEMWPGQEPVGQSIAWPAASGAARAPLLVVGVVADTRDLEPGAPAPLAMYMPFAQRPTPHILVVRAHGDNPVPESSLRRIIADVNPGVAFRGSRTLFDRLQAVARPQRTASAWIAVFGVIALLLASIGLYGVVAQGVVQRRRELAVRAALGASPRGIIESVVGDGMRLVAIGALAGTICAFAAFRVLASLFAGVNGVDARTAAAAVVALVVATLVATWLPARVAAKLSPVEALRAE